MKFLRFYKPAENADTLLVSPESVRVLQGSRTNRKISFKKKLAHAVMALANPKSARWISRLENQEERMLQFKSKGH